MSVSRLRLLLVVVALFVAITTSAAGRRESEEQPVITFGAHSVTASNITPGKQVVFFGIGRIGLKNLRRLTQWQKVLTDDDHDGAVTFDLGQYPTIGSVWAVADLANAKYAIAPGPNTMWSYLPAPNQPFRNSTTFAFDGGFPYLDILYVHPGFGAWVWWTMDGGFGDADGKPNGTITVLISDGLPLGDSGPPPASFVPGGVVVAIDWLHMQIIAIPANAVGGGAN